MKPTGIIRHIDDLGRVVIPKDIRKSLGIAEGDPLEILDDGNKIVIKKHKDACVFCGSGVGLMTYRGKCLCIRCAVALRGDDDACTL